jgi:tetratricopeptide (TPR) repeat protein
MARWKSLAFVALVVLVGQPIDVRADETDEELAKRYYKLGETLYHRSEFEGALKQFKRSYDLSKKAALLFNIARCHESLGQHAEAVAAYEAYLESNPRNTENVRMRIKNLRRLIEKNKQDEPPQPAPDEPKVTATQTPTEDVEREAPAAPTAADDRSRPLRLTGWILAGSGAALLVTGTVMGVMARSKQSELEDANTAGEEYRDYKGTHDQGDALNKACIATLVVGGLAAAAGAVLVVLDWRANRERREAWVAPVLDRRGVVITAGLRF